MITLDMPLWHKDYFELKATEKKQTHEEISILPVSIKKQSILSLLKVSSSPISRKKRTTLNTKDEDSIEMSLYEQTLLNNPYPLLVSLICLHSKTLPSLEA